MNKTEWRFESKTAERRHNLIFDIIGTLWLIGIMAAMIWLAR